jgi:hypothetical protein
MIGKEAIERLARALESPLAERPLFAETLAIALSAIKPEAEALMIERRLYQLAAAAEELGPDASIEDIGSRAREIAARPI